MPTAPDRQSCIALERRHVLADGAPADVAAMAPWLLRSWQRCLQSGMRPGQAAHFNAVSAAQALRTAQANHHLRAAAQGTLQQLAQTIRNTRYFVILTNADGTVVDACGAIDTQDRYATLITRVGTDLSEPALGTTAISTALTEQHPVWLHRGEHFLEATSVYSCAGAPLMGPQGTCVGMLDVTGVNVTERPELKHLVAQAARQIENQLVLASAPGLVLRLNWAGVPLGTDADGLISLHPDGWVQGANPVARQIVGGLNEATTRHCSELFGMAVGPLMDAARAGVRTLDLPLWSGLHLQGQVNMQGGATKSAPAAVRPLRDVQASLIRRAMDDARGNVAQAAQTLGLSRATLYRKLRASTL